MTSVSPERRSRRRVLLEVAALGLVALVALVWAKRGDVSRGDASEGPEREGAPEAAEEPTAAPLSIPSGPGAWKAMSQTELEAVGRHVAEITPGFRFDRVESFSGADLSNAITVLVHEKTQLEFSLIPPGNFLMGSPDSEAGRTVREEPRHRVTFQRAFLIARTECTQAAWDRIGGEDDRARAGASLPIESVSWDSVTDWCRQADLRLPSEAEWEYACRAGTTTRYWPGDDEADLDRVGWYDDNRGGDLHAVAEKRANPFGLFDVHGNLWEWCEDNSQDSYEGAPADGSAWIDPAFESRVIRGGSFFLAARNARSAYRVRIDPGSRGNGLGFRPARSVAAD